MNTPGLKKLIREVLSKVLSEASEPKYFIKYSPKRKVFILYKRFRGYDRFHRMNDQIEVVKELSADPHEAQLLAKEIIGQDLPIRQASDRKVLNKGDVVLPFDSVRGKKIKEVPIGQLIQLIINAKWMSRLKIDKYKATIYEYLIYDVHNETTAFLTKWVSSMTLPSLINWYNARVLRNGPGEEIMVFSNILIPLMRAELSKRNMKFRENGEVILPES